MPDGAPLVPVLPPEQDGGLAFPGLPCCLPPPAPHIGPGGAGVPLYLHGPPGHAFKVGIPFMLAHPALDLPAGQVAHQGGNLTLPSLSLVSRFQAHGITSRTNTATRTSAARIDATS